MSDIKIVIGAEVAGAEAGLKKVQTELKNTATSADKADKALNIKGVTTLSNQANNAASSLTNLGKGLEDLSNKSVEASSSFEGSSTATEGFSSSISDLGISLLAGGVAAGMSVLIELGQEFIMSFFDASDAAENFSQKIAILKIDLEEAKYAGDSLKSSIDSLRDLRSVNLKIGIPGEGAKAQLDRLTIDFGYRINEEEKILKNLREQEEAAREASIGTFRLLRSSGSSTMQDLISSTNTLNQIKKQSESLSKDDLKLLDAAIQAENELFKINDLINSQIFKIATLNGQNKLDIEEINKKEQERLDKIRTIADVLAEMNDEIRKLNAREVLLNTNESINKIKAMEKAFNELIEKFKLGFKNPIIVDLAFKINEAKARLAFDELLARIKLFSISERLGEKDKMKIVVNVQPQFKTDPAGINKAAIDLADQVNDIVKSVFVDAFSGLGEAIGDALSGVSIDGAFSGIVKSLAGGLKAIGKKIIEANVQLAILKKIGFSNPVVGIAVGVAITALGAALQNAVSKQKAFATGVRNFGGGTALVGERGPEMVYLPKGSSVQPNNELNAYGGGQMVFIPDITLRGTDLVIAFNRASDAMGRNN